jgi:hypothetical protein
MTPEALQHLKDTVAWGDARLATMEQLIVTLRELEAQHTDILWRKTALSGPNLFQASCHLERETASFKGWLDSQKRELFFAEVNKAPYARVEDR